MINAVLIDDEPQARASLSQLLASGFPVIDLVGEADNVASGIHLIKALKPQLVFLDVEMPDGTGFDVLSGLDKVDFEVIFVTAHDRFAIKAFEFFAYGYLLKPVDTSHLGTVLGRLERHLGQDRGGDQRMEMLQSFYQQPNRPVKKIILDSQQGFEVVKLEQVLYLEGDGNCTHFHLLDQSRITVTKTLKTYDQLLEPSGFFRCHKSYLINLRHVLAMKRSEGDQVELKGDHRVPVSRRRKQALIEKLT